MLALKHRIIRNTALPYITNISPTDPTPRYISGSSNILTSNKGYAERRPGFDIFSSDDSTGPLSRIFTWRRWGSDFFVMANFFTGGGGTTNEVFKMKVGTDANFISILNSGAVSERYDFAVANNHVYMCNGTDMKKYDGTTVTNWGITAPSAAVSTSLGGTGLTAVAGYKYIIAWENSTSGEYSSISPFMTSRVIPNNQTVTISGNTTADGQVDRVRIWRTTDGGTKYFEHPSSPISYASWTGSGLADSTADASLVTANEAAPQFQNNRPVASKGVVFFAGRLWTFAGDKVYFSALEELKRTQGLGVSAFPPDNFYPFGAEVTALSVTQDALLVHAPPVIYRITGDTRATFTRDVLAARAGARNRAAVFSTGRVSAWLDYTNTVRVTDGLTVSEISFPIRDQLQGINHSSAALTIHDDGTRHWIVLMDGGNNRLLVYDQDLGQWMPPWSFSTMESVYSGETAAGTVKLFLGSHGVPHAMNATNYQDAGAAYTANLRTSLIELVEGGKPEDFGDFRYIGTETNAVTVSDASIMYDEDPSAGGTYVSLFANATDIPQRTQGTNLVEKIYHSGMGALSRRVSAKLDWSAANSNFKLYTLDLGYKETVR